MRSRSEASRAPPISSSSQASHWRSLKGKRPCIASRAARARSRSLHLRRRSMYCVCVGGGGGEGVRMCASHPAAGAVVRERVPLAPSQAPPPGSVRPSHRGRKGRVIVRRRRARTSTCASYWLGAAASAASSAMMRSMSAGDTSTSSSLLLPLPLLVCARGGERGGGGMGAGRRTLRDRGARCAPRASRTRTRRAAIAPSRRGPAPRRRCRPRPWAGRPPRPLGAWRRAQLAGRGLSDLTKCLREARGVEHGQEPTRVKQ